VLLLSAEYGRLGRWFACQAQEKAAKMDCRSRDGIVPRSVIIDSGAKPHTPEPEPF